MAAKKQSKKSLTSAQKAGIGVGLTAAAVTAAGAYFLYGSKNAKKNQKKVKSWMLRAKAEVLEGLENAEKMTEDEFMHLVETVGGTYSSLKDASKADIKAFKNEMVEHWPKIVKEGKQIANTVSKVAKKKAAPKKTATPRPTSSKKNSGGQAKKKVAAKKPVAKKAPAKKKVTKKTTKK